MSKLKNKYQEEIKAKLQEKFGYNNVMQIPALKKVVISMGLAEAARDKNVLQSAMKELTLISGQKPLVCNAKKSVSNFKLRQGQAIGLKVTLRGKRMYDFLERLFNFIMPRIRDFRGFKPKGDKRGNYSLGIEDQQIFPELNLDEVNRVQGMNISFITSANEDEECIELLRLLGLPFQGLPVVVN